MKYNICAGSIYLEDAVLENSCISVEDGIISEIGAQNGGEVIELKGLKLLPGLVDMHIHGGGGVDTMDDGYDAINALSLYKLKEGVTSFCPTTVTATLEDTERALKNVSSAMDKGVDGAEILGPFIEGPYISVQYKGAHAEDRIREASLKEIEGLIDYTKGKASMIIAPELPGAVEIVKFLKSKGVGIRLGHTGASYEQVMAAVEAGANVAVHTFNAMSPMTAREPGLVGAVLSSDEIYAELICDLQHTHRASALALTKAKPLDKIVLVTDCMMAGGLSDGEYNLGEMKVTVKDAIARTPDGKLAGSTLRLIDAVKNMHKVVGISLSAAVNMASINPAKVMGASDTVGSLSPGKKANLIAIDDDFNIKFIMKDGKIVLK